MSTRRAGANPSNDSRGIDGQAAALKTAWADHFSNIPWEFMATLTFDPRRNSPSRSAAVDEGRWWCGQLARLRRASVGWLFVVERGAGGRALHLHVLIAGLRPLDRALAASLWDVRNGAAHLRDVDDRRKAVAYVTKNAYATGDVHFADDLARHLGPDSVIWNIDEPVADVAPEKPVTGEPSPASALQETSNVPEFLSPTELMRYLRLSRTAVYEALRAGSIPSVRIGRSYRIARAAIVRMAGAVE